MPCTSSDPDATLPSAPAPSLLKTQWAVATLLAATTTTV